MKKLIVLGMAVLFVSSVVASGAFAFGDCPDKAHKKTKVTGPAKTDKDAA